ncbi:MAG: enoyl-CoA hydratase/isomerase family protein [Deltaproteobacteria bacterium]|nr:enoyl-CoA hydratase/isomerase family protein [Deltaproteobacteria bacterium]
MVYETILVDRKEHVGVITLNRPALFNTISSAMAGEINGALLALEGDKVIRVVVVQGAGKAFCTGIDISEFEGKTLHEYREWVESMMHVVRVIAGMKKPVIASVHGYAVANGAGLIAACDLAVVSEDTKIGTTAVNVGLFCMGPAVPLSRSIGRKRCLEMILTGDLIDAERAERWGLVNRVVPRDRLEEETMALALKLAEKSPMAVQMGKQAFYGMSDMAFNDALSYSNELFAALCVTEDAGEGVDAFLKKRKPRWKET